MHFSLWCVIARFSILILGIPICYLHNMKIMWCSGALALLDFLCKLDVNIC